MSKINIDSHSPRFQESHSIDLNLSKILNQYNNRQENIKISIGQLLLKTPQHKRSDTKLDDKEDKENKQFILRQQKTDQSFLQRNQLWHQNKNQKIKEIAQLTVRERENNILKECTFKPQITNKPLKQQKNVKQPLQILIPQLVKKPTPINLQSMQQQLHKQLLTLDI